MKTLGEDQFGTLTSQMLVEPELLDLLKRKGVFPYDFMSDSKLSAMISKLSATCLPSKERFYNQLNKSEISDEDYDHACKVWETFGCKTMTYT